MFEKSIVKKRGGGELMHCIGQMWMYLIENEKQTCKYWVV